MSHVSSLLIPGVRRQTLNGDMPEPCLTKALRPHSQKEMMLIFYFDAHGVILADFYDNGIVTGEVCGFLEAFQ